MAKKEFMNIHVDTVPNGFNLKVFGHEYHFWDETALFEGMLYHAGMAIVKDENKDVIRDVVADLFADKEDARLLMMQRNQQQQIEIEKYITKAKKLESENYKLKKKMERLSKRSNNPFGIDDFD